MIIYNFFAVNLHLFEAFGHANRVVDKLVVAAATFEVVEVVALID